MEGMNVITIIAAGLMVGCEVAVAAFIHPTLNTLPDEAHLPAASALARVLGRFMPPWYALVALLLVAEAVLEWHQSGRLPIWFATSALLWIVAIVFSLTALVPINNRIASWERTTPPADWKTDRNRWDMLHRWRTLLLTIALGLLILGVVSR